MFRLGLKLWSTNRHYVEEAKRLAAEQKCAYIELYAVPGSWQEFGALWQEIDVPYVIHAPHFLHGMNLADAAKRDSNRELAKQAFEFADFLNANPLIFHPGVAGDDGETIRQLNAWPVAWKNQILIENKPYKTIDGKLICNGNSPEAIEGIMQATGVGFCFDIGHGICSSNSRKTDAWRDMERFERLGPALYHLSDNDFASEIDGHKNLGHGNFDFHKIFEIIDTSKRISLETEKKYADSLRDFEEDVRFLHRVFYYDI